MWFTTKAEERLRVVASPHTKPFIYGYQPMHKTTYIKFSVNLLGGLHVFAS